MYRLFLEIVEMRLRASRTIPAAPPAYTDSNEFASDLSLLRDSLCQNHGARIAELAIDPLLRAIQTFGFHLHTFDIRRAWRGFWRETLSEFSSAAAGNLDQQSGGKRSAAVSERSRETMNTFRTIALLKQIYPPRVRSARSSSAIRNPSRTSSTCSV